MSSRQFESMDDQLRSALARRAIRPDDELTADLLVAEMFRVAGSTQQRGRWWQLPRLNLGFDRWTPVIVALLVALLAASAAIGAALIIRPQPPTNLDQTNGVIVYLRGGQLQQAFPGRPGTVSNPEIELPGVIGSTDITWAPDGRRFAYAARGGAWIVDAATGSAELAIECGMEATACSIDWAPDGSQLAVAQSDTLKLVNIDGTEPTLLATFPGEHVGHVTWSPDSSRIAFVVDTAAGRVLYVIHRSGSGRSILYGPSPSGGIGIWDPEWSPDGTRIAYIGSTPNAESVDVKWRLNVTMIDADGSNARVVLDDAGVCACLGYYPGLAWAPDGTSIALAIPGPGNSSGGTSPGDLYVMKADGTDLRLVAEGGGFGAIAWQPLPK